MAKQKKKIWKIIIGILIFITLPSLLFFAFLYFNYNQELPIGIEGKRADALASKMLNALNSKAYDTTEVFEWTFKNRRHYKWKKTKNICEVYWEDNKVRLNFNDTSLNQAYVHSFKVGGVLAEELTQKALKYFNNDSFWLFAPYKVFDEGVKRSIVNTTKGDLLLVTYKSGDSYLWELNQESKPISFKMWTSKLPINGLDASWTDWTTTENGVELPTFHKILFFGIDISQIKGVN